MCPVSNLVTSDNGPTYRTALGWHPSARDAFAERCTIRTWILFECSRLRNQRLLPLRFQLHCPLSWFLQGKNKWRPSTPCILSLFWSRFPGLQHLRQFISQDAFHDSLARSPPPTCHPLTREKVLRIISDWIEEPQPRRHIMVKWSRWCQENRHCSDYSRVLLRQAVSSVFFLSEELQLVY